MGRAFIEKHDGFILRKSKIELPLRINALDAALQRDLLISHLFANNCYFDFGNCRSLRFRQSQYY